MGFSAHRLANVARSTGCESFTAAIVFSTLLTIISVLYQPTRGLDDLQKLGWRSWATVSESKSTTDGRVVIENITTRGGNISPENVLPGTDWWDVETPEPEVGGFRLHWTYGVLLCLMTPVVSVTSCSAQNSTHGRF